MAQDLEIVELKIQMHTNKDTIEELTADKFKTDKPVSGKYPFLCTNYRYSKDLLNYKTLSERVSLFFDRIQFYNFITASKIKKKQKFITANNVDDTVFEKKIQETMNDSEFYKGPKDLNDLKSVMLKISKLNKQNIIDNLDEKPKTPINNKDDFVNYLSKLSKKKEINNAIVKENITIMLNALFPISFPIQDQVTLMDETNLDLMNMIKRIFKTNEYAYLNIGKVSTVIQVIWLNTISSNPTYYQLYQKIKKYYKMIFNYIDENITEKNIQDFVSSSDDDSKKLINIKTFLNTIIGYNSKYSKYKLTDKNICILYFLLFDDDEQKLYNQFIKEFIKEFINDNTSSIRYVNSDQYYRTEFFDYLKKTTPEIENREIYIKEIDEYLPPKRVSTDKKLKNSLVNKNNFSEFFELFEKYGKNYSGIDKIGNGVYEIQIGIALVGGKITTTNYTFLCNYNSHRLGKNLNYLIKNTKEDSQNVQLYNYIDLENVKDTTEYIGVVNSKFKTQKNNKEGNKGGYRRRNKKKTRRQIKI